jgi:hypothetical protein
VGTLMSGSMVGVMAAHGLEDVLLLSIGRFLPVPIPLMYGVGLLFSWLVLGGILCRVRHSPMRDG